MQSSGKVSRNYLGTAICRYVPSPGGRTSSCCLRGQLWLARESWDKNKALAQNGQPQRSVLEVWGCLAQADQEGWLVRTFVDI